MEQLPPWHSGLTTRKESGDASHNKSFCRRDSQRIINHFVAEITKSPCWREWQSLPFCAESEPRASSLPGGDNV